MPRPPIDDLPIDRARLPTSVRDALAKCGPESDTLRAVLDAYLEWEGIRGYTSPVLTIFGAVKS